MKNFRVGVISAGDMGHAVARELFKRGHTTLTIVENRTDLTKDRAFRSNMKVVSGMKQLLDNSDFVFSIMPPDQAFEFAASFVAALKLSRDLPVFVDCNAISPETTLSMNELISGVGGKMIKVGIIGPPPGMNTPTKFYASGENAILIDFIAGGDIQFLNLGSNLIYASAIKICYAALTKGVMALQSSALIAAELLGVGEELQDELKESQNFHWKLIEKRVSRLACDAGRWAGEMDQISETYQMLGLTPNLHKGVGDIFRLLEMSPLGNETRETYDHNRSLQESLNIYKNSIK